MMASRLTMFMQAPVSASRNAGGLTARVKEL
jgi:hypothetical protein